MVLRNLVRRLPAEQLEELLSDLAFEVYERGASGWRGVLRVRDELHDVTVGRARKSLHRRLDSALRKTG